MRAKPIIITLLAVIGLAAIGLVFAWRPAIALENSKEAFDRASIARGAGLSAVGDCGVCHTAPRQPPYAGGRALATPFGVVYSSNITPDQATGIGLWSFTAFRRAMVQGVGRNGAHLYPAFPYDHFTHLTDQDLRDLYAFQMTRTPEPAPKPANRLIPPLGLRPLLFGWKLLFLHTGPLPTDPGLSTQEARGRYLAEGLGHCGACHSPRNLLGAEKPGRAYDGGWADGWWAPPLNGGSTAVRAWTADRLYSYLRTGLDPQHAAAAGPMREVARNLSSAPDPDVRAIAAYFARMMRTAPAALREPELADRDASAARAEPEGARLYAGACAVCHEQGSGMVSSGGRPLLPLGTPFYEPTPRDAIAIILDGLQPPVGRSGPYMPGFADSFDDDQMAHLVAYLQARHRTGPAWTNLQREVSRARKGAQGS